MSKNRKLNRHTQKNKKGGLKGKGDSKGTIVPTSTSGGTITNPTQSMGNSDAEIGSDEPNFNVGIRGDR